MPPGVADRTVRITGEDLEQLMRAVALILTKLAPNPNYSRFTSTSVSCAPSTPHRLPASLPCLQVWWLWAGQVVSNTAFFSYASSSCISCIWAFGTVELELAPPCCCPRV